ncbi:extracellular solute-binding protein [Paenibacillaceae bacterium]|nr:extracellular solute-binding protein [Paenibacillaceae bacterium]
MDKKSKTFILLLMVVSMVFVLATGCSDANNQVKPNKNQESDANDKGQVIETFKFSVTAQSNGVDNTNSIVYKEWIKLMEEKMGKKIEIDWNYIPASDYDSKVKLEIASNNLTDFFAAPLFYDTAEMAEQGQILDFSQYKDSMPNYMNFLGQVKDGLERTTNADGSMYYFKETSTPRFPSDKGMLIQNASAYRYDLFEKHNIKMPETFDELYEAAKELKELYPNKYPINTRWKSLRSIFNANHVQNEIYWDGGKFVHGIFEPGYRDALEFAYKLYAGGLLDPEYLVDTDDLIKQKALNGDNFIWLTQWFTDPANYTRTANDGKIFAVSLYPANPKYGTAWQNAVNANTPDLGWGAYCISSTAKNPEELIKFIDLQYDPEVMRLLTWGIEGTTYELNSEGNPTFVDEFKNADDPWVVGDKYGIRASKSYRPGLQVSNDASAFVDFAAIDFTYFDGKYEEVAIEKNEFLRNLPMPQNEYVPAWYDAPTVQFTQDESQQIAEIMTPIKTYIEEQEARFVSGKESFDNWDSFINKVKGMGDVEKVLKIHNDAAQRAMGN